MQWKLFIDDLRDPIFNDWLVARTCKEAIALVNLMGVPSEISFDHDLGVIDGKDTNTKEFMWFLIDGHLDGRFNLHDVKSVTVHSANPPGAEALIGLWDGFAREKNISVQAVYAPRA